MSFVTEDSKQGPMPESIVGSYRLERTIGQGTYGKVKIATNIHTDEKAAVKLIEKATIHSPKQVARLQREIRFLKLLYHPHIVKVHEVVETPDFIYIIMEYAAGGELFDYIVSHKRVKEKEARTFFRMVLSAVDYCHQNSVIHRDLKPENLLLDDQKCIKIIDFGFGNNFTTDGLLDTFCGSPFYAAPEMILGKKYEGPEVDMWSLGVILFALLCGHLPFDDDNMKELYKKIAAGTYTCPDHLAPAAKHLIARCITVDPKRRATLQEVLSHPWVNDGYERPPHHYIPDRPIIADASKLSKDIINRLTAFGYKFDEIHRAFESKEDQARPHPIRATYWLLVEMLQREEARVKLEKKRCMDKFKASTSVITAEPSSTPALPIIREDGATAGDPIKSYTAVAALSIAASSTQVAGESGSYGVHLGLLSGNGPRAEPSQRARSHLEISTESRAAIKSTTPASQYGLDSASCTNSHARADSLAAESNTRPTSINATAYSTMPRHASRKQATTVDAAALLTVQPKDPPTTSSSTSKTDVNEALPLKSIHERRFSSPVASYLPTRRASSSRSASSSSSEEDDMRAVSGWFLNVATTSSKPAHDICAEVKRVLEQNNCRFAFDGRFTFTCEMNLPPALVAGEPSRSRVFTAPSTAPSARPITAGSLRASFISRRPSLLPTSNTSQASEHPASLESNASLGRPKTKAAIQFSIEICKVPRMNLLGLQFKRINGGSWDYKKLCGRLLNEMNL
ncbi:hypothetical protein SeLEV6574_g01893 [Synchytrium endobioticum]|uniref:non-specific serine/threonine protein kinase n=1 Tax=Synchytrium endobioticum TaxID=286115 RepID=A0A507DBL3_9FUNG|nr:hypothetical protein SeLEV6574_g01893 [Synchytrium endobioticum]